MGLGLQALLAMARDGLLPVVDPNADMPSRMAKFDVPTYAMAKTAKAGCKKEECHRG